MAIGFTNISLKAIRALLSGASGSLKALAVSNNINPYAYYKPVHIDATYTRRDGLYRKTTGFKELEYKRPTGGASSPYKLAHFGGYDHAAEPPVVFEITNIKTLGGVSIWNAGSPVLWIGESYLFSFRYRRGINAIDPSTIDAETQWTKQTYGYGGITVLTNARYQDQFYDIPLARAYSVLSTSWATVSDLQCVIDFDINDPDTFNPTYRPLWVEYINTISGGLIRRTYKKIETQFVLGSYPAFTDLLPEIHNQSVRLFSMNYDGDYTTIEFFFFYGNSRQIIPDWFIELYALNDSSNVMGFTVSFRITTQGYAEFSFDPDTANFTAWNYSVPYNSTTHVYTFDDSNVGWAINENYWLQIQMVLSGDQRTAYNHVHFNAYNTPGALYLVEDIYEDTGH